ncbi:Hok/Gef family protein [Serratia bockelmannii]|nr:Hok/Gef family protein [Serratia bockelmannii]MDH7590279.1 Hok/Gef family protein [Serratia bockelmannii]
MQQKRVVLKLVIVCMTLIAFIWLTRGSLCVRIRLGDSEVAATLAYESER